MKFVLVLFCLFPYVGFGFLTIDTKPWALIFAALILIIQSKKGKLIYPYQFNYFLVSFLVAFIVFLFEVANKNGNIVYGITSLSYYLSTPLVALAVLNVGIPKRFNSYFLIIYLIWFAFAIIQKYAPGINDFFVGNIRTSNNRGLTSLAPEPVWYARSILLFLMISLLMYYRDIVSKKYLVFIFMLSIIQIVVFSLSGTIFFYLILVVSFYVFIIIESIRVKIVVASLFFFLGIFAISYGLKNYSDKRLFYLINIALERPEDLSKFGGFNMRVLNAPLGIKAGLIDSYGLGVGVLPDEIVSSSYQFKFLSENVDKEDSGKLNGGYVLFIYQIGVFGFFWIVGIITLLNRDKNLGKRVRLFFIISIFLVLFFESSLSNPISAYLIGFLMIRNQQSSATLAEI
jgi:hypothetical protein